MIRENLSFYKAVNFKYKESIPVGCVPTTYRTYPIISPRHTHPPGHTPPPKTYPSLPGQTHPPKRDLVSEMAALPVDRQTPVKTLPSATSLGDGNHLFRWSRFLSLFHEAENFQINVQVYNWVSLCLT